MQAHTARGATRQVSVGRPRPATVTAGARRPVAARRNAPTAQPPAVAAAPNARRAAAPQKQRQVAARAIALDAFLHDPNTLVAGVSALLAAVGLATGLAQNNASASAEAAPAETFPEVSDAVLVFGAKGRTGRLVVQQLLGAGRTVVAAVRSADKAKGVFSELGIAPGPQPDGGLLLVRGGVDVTKQDAITPDMFQGVSQVVIAMGAVAGRLPDGSFGYTDGAAPKDVEGKGVENILKTMRMYMEPQRRSVKEVVPMRSAKDLSVWDRTFRMAVNPSEDGHGAVWTGTVEEDGAPCAARTRQLDLDLSEFDGLSLRVRGDGQTFQLDARSSKAPDTVYEVQLDTPETGDWTTLHLPWHSWVAVKDGKVDPDAEPLTGADISELSLALSKYSFNAMPNMHFHSGNFELGIDGGISAYRDPRPQLVVLSSAGVERSALLGDNADARGKEMPIVRQNPGQVLDWKYEAECAVRASGFPYAVVRATALDESEAAEGAAAAGPYLLEADQGDQISGKVARPEAASVIVAALGAPTSANKTFELRRSEAADARGKAMGARQFNRMFLKLVPDSSRWRVGLPPFPAIVAHKEEAPAAAPAADAAAAADAPAKKVVPAAAAAKKAGVAAAKRAAAKAAVAAGAGDAAAAAGGKEEPAPAAEAAVAPVAAAAAVVAAAAAEAAKPAAAAAVEAAAAPAEAAAAPAEAPQVPKVAVWPPRRASKRFEKEAAEQAAAAAAAAADAEDTKVEEKEEQMVAAR